MIVTRRKVLSSALVASVTGARAQASYPVRPITLVVPLSAGGASDVTARVFSKAASEVLGQPIIIQNHPGGGGVVGTTQVRNAKPDGYTLLLALCGVHTTLPEINPLPFDPITGLQPISNLISFLSALVVPSSSPARSLGELLTWARQKPGGLSFGSQAVASPQHMMGIILGKLGNAPVTHVPYTGGGALTMDLVSGRLDFAFPSLLNLGSSFKSGEVRPLAAATTERLEEMPDVPTFAELGYGSAVVETWFGLMAPPDTPKSIVDTLNAAYRRAGADPTIQRKMLEVGFRVSTSTPEELLELMITDRRRLAPLVREFSLKAE